MEGILIVDPQNDFFPGGALAVPNGDEIIEPIQRLIRRKCVEQKPGCKVYVTQDWHPEDTVHFKTWPPHCVQYTEGADIRDEIFDAISPLVDVEELLDSGHFIVSAYLKGMDPNDDSGYSAFDGVAEGKIINGCWVPEAGDPLLDILRGDGVDTLIVCGLATDYCVKASVLDALKHGFKVKVLTDAIRAVNLRPEDGDKALEEMRTKGAELCEVKDL